MDFIKGLEVGDKLFFLRDFHRGSQPEFGKSSRIFFEKNILIHNFMLNIMYKSMKIQRIIQPQVENRMVPGKVVVLLGPRQVGKTTMLRDILAKESAPFLFVSGEDRATQAWLGSQSIETCWGFVGKLPDCGTPQKTRLHENLFQQLFLAHL